jgi:hypothetical protein
MRTAEVSVCNSFQYTYCVCKLLSQGRYLRIISIVLLLSVLWATTAHVHVQQLTQEQDMMVIVQFRQGRLGRWRKVENASKVSNATRRVGQIGAQKTQPMFWVRYWHLQVAGYAVCLQEQRVQPKGEQMTNWRFIYIYIYTHWARRLAKHKQIFVTTDIFIIFKSLFDFTHYAVRNGGFVWSVMTAHVQRAPRLRMSGTVPPIPYMGFYGVYRVRFPLAYLHYTGWMYVHMFCVDLRTNSHYFPIQH